MELAASRTLFPLMIQILNETASLHKSSFVTEISDLQIWSIGIVDPKMKILLKNSLLEFLHTVMFEYHPYNRIRKDATVLPVIFL